ncbi:MAG TPA: tetratricopeptide repeat protein, partial [Candidatus Acidoferrales bacterium]|nr:tetratricopeptide repeat protein [Candidatus Acidoferrales bacterium]
ALDIIHDLGQQTMTSSRTALPAIAPATAAPVVAPPATSAFQRYRLWIAAGSAVLILAIAAVFFRGRIFGPRKHAAGGPTVSLLILPFRNVSHDASIDWMGKSLAEMLRTDVGQSEGFRTVSPDRLHQILEDLRISADSDLDESTIHRIAEFTNADQVVSGQYVKMGDQIRIDGTLANLKSQRTTPIEAEGADQKSLLDALAKKIQENLTLPSEDVEELKAAAFTPSSKSVDALRAYSEGMELSREGNTLQAAKQFQSATTADPDFALAYSRLAQSYSNLGHDKEAEQFSSKAVELSNNLPPAEKDMIQASNARITKNYDSAVQTYSDLLKLMPNDPQVHFEIASVYEAHGALDQARAHFLQALQTDPKYVDALLAVGRVEIEQGNPQAALGHLNSALSLAVQLGQQQGKASILQMIGTAYRNMNKPDDALQNLQQAFDIEKQIGDKKGMAWSLSQIAEAHNSQGKPDQAEKEYRDVLKLDQEIGDQSGTGFTLLNLGNVLGGEGRYDEAINLTKQSQQIMVQIGDENTQALALNNIGSFYLSEGHSDDALTYLQQALALRQKLKLSSDIAQTMSNIGDTYRTLGQYDKALDSYLHALELSRGANDKFSIAMTSDSMSFLFEAQGRYGAALKSQEEALKDLRDLQQQDVYFATIEADYGHALSLVGRFDEAQKNLDDALKLARSFKADPLVAQILDFEGERLFYGGDFKSARPLFDQSAQAAARAKDRDDALKAKFNQARLAVFDGRASTAPAAFRALAKEADGLGQKYLAVESSLYSGIALVMSKNYSQGQREISAALSNAQAASMKSLLPQAHYWLAVAMKGSGDKSGAATHFAQATSMLQEMRQESQSDSILKREDLKAIAEASRPAS